MKYPVYVDKKGPHIFIPTLEGNMRANNLDWIIKGVNEEFYPCKPDIFEKTYEAAFEKVGLTFGEAVEAIKTGKRIARSGWNGSGMYAYIVPAASYPAQTEVAKKEFVEFVPYRAYFALKTAKNDVATWAPSGSDCLAEDWYIVE